MSPPHASPESAILSTAPCVTPEADPARWFKQEVHPHDGQLKAYLRGQFPTVRDVDDLVQESYLRIWKIKACEEILSAKAFLYRIARHLALDHVRRQRIAPMDSVEDLDSLPALDNEPSAADALVSQELFARLGDAIIALPAHYREVIILHKIQGFSQKEVAARLCLSPKSVEKYVQRGLARCEAYLQAQGVHGFTH